MKALLCISAIILGARLGARGAESVDYLREIKPLLRDLEAALKTVGDLIAAREAEQRARPAKAAAGKE